MAIATLVQLMGEEKAFDYLEEAARERQPVHALGHRADQGGGARRDHRSSISFVHDGVTEALAGFPVKTATPCEGTGYEIGSMSIIKGARNLDNAKKFYDWALTARRAEARRRGQAVPGAVEQGDTAAAARRRSSPTSS